MRPISYLLSFIAPQCIDCVRSPINGDIRVETSFGKNRLVVGGYWQSGEYETGVITTCLTDLPISISEGDMALLLGLGGGSAIDVFRRLFPSIAITAVDIDPLMVSLGKKYLRNYDGAGVKTVIGDAYDFVMNRPHRNPYAIILVDTYIACTMPPFAQTRPFLRALKRITRKGGVCIYNASYTEENQKKSDLLVAAMKGEFLSVECIHRPPNLIIRAYP